MTYIINSLLENDFYKFTMQRLIWQLYPDVNVEYEFFNRGKTQFPKGFAEKLIKEVGSMGWLRFKEEEIEFLEAYAPFLGKTYLEWLSNYTPDDSNVVLGITQEGGDLRIKISGKWLDTIFWEVPVMAIISELYFKEMGVTPSEDYISRARDKASYLKKNGIVFTDFGLRRRFSGEVQRNVVNAMEDYFKSNRDTGGYVGTSNVLLSYENDETPKGTMAHELFMVYAAIYGFQSANRKVLEDWQQIYGDNAYLGTALPDTFTTPVFLRDFSRRYANAFGSVRQDSGIPEEFADLMISHYQKLGIDSLTKTIIFSDSLTPERCVEIAKYCEGRIKCAFGIGTNFTNDVGVTPLNMVIKITKAGREGWPLIPTVKLSDTPGKVTGDVEIAKIARTMLGI